MGLARQRVREDRSETRMRGNVQSDLHPPELPAAQDWERDPGSCVSASGGCQKEPWDAAVPGGAGGFYSSYLVRIFPGSSAAAAASAQPSANQRPKQRAYT